MNQKVFDIMEKFYKGQISKEEADKIIKMDAERNEKKAVKHIPGRYDKTPFVYYTATGTTIIHSPDLLSVARRAGEAAFSTQEAEDIRKQQNAYLTLIDKIHELNDGWVPDWTFNNQEKYYFYFDHTEKQLGQNHSYVYQHLKNELYFKHGVYGRLVEKLGNELIKLAIGI